MTSDVRYEIKTELKLRYLFSDLKLLTLKKSGFVRTQRTTHNWSWFLVGWSGRWWRCWRDRPTNWSSKLLTICDLKKMEEYQHSSDLYRSSLLTLHWLGNILMWSQINVRSSIRLTGGRQIDFKVFKPFLNDNEELYVFQHKAIKRWKYLFSLHSFSYVCKANLLHFGIFFIWNSIFLHNLVPADNFLFTQRCYPGVID